MVLVDVALRYEKELVFWNDTKPYDDILEKAYLRMKTFEIRILINIYII